MGRYHRHLRSYCFRDHRQRYFQQVSSLGQLKEHGLQSVHGFWRFRPPWCWSLVGISGLAAGMAIGIVGDAGTRAIGQQPGLFVPNLLILIFAEALALYGLIVALIMQGYANIADDVCQYTTQS